MRSCVCTLDFNETTSKNSIHPFILLSVMCSMICDKWHLQICKYKAVVHSRFALGSESISVREAVDWEMVFLEAALFLALCASISSGVTVRDYNEIYRTDLDSFEEFSSRYLTHFEMLENTTMTNTNILLGVSTPEVCWQKHRTVQVFDIQLINSFPSIDNL